MQKALGAPVRTFSFNRWWAFFYALGAILLMTIAVSAVVMPDGALWAGLLMSAFALLCCYACARTLAARAVIHEYGIAYRTLGHSGQMLWSEIEGYRYAVTKTYHQGIIPTTTYTITLLDTAGNKAELGSNVQKPKELGQMLWNKLHPMLRDKILARLDARQSVQLDRLKLTPEGIELNPPIGKTVFLPAERVVGCDLQNGMLRVFESVNGKQKSHALMLSNIYNAFPALEIINRRLCRNALETVGAR